LRYFKIRISWIWYKRRNKLRGWWEWVDKEEGNCWGLVKLVNLLCGVEKFKLSLMFGFG